jgi:hypothetical protein
MPQLVPPRECLSRRFAYAPGNGTLYELIVTDLGDGFVLTWTNSVVGGKAATLRWDALPPHPAYLAEKLWLHPDSADVHALIDFLILLQKES